MRHIWSICARALLLTTVVLLLFGSAEANAVEEMPPLVQPIQGFGLDDAEFENFSSYDFVYQQDGKRTKRTVKGKYWFLYYEYSKGDRTFSKLEIIENHKQAVLEKAGDILSEDNTKLDFVLPLPQEGRLWGHLHTWVDSYELYLIQEEGFEKRLTFNAEEMKKELDTAGHVAIYGIYFDFDKSTLKEGSEKVLIEMVKLMKQAPELRVEIQGHTDSVGTPAYNKKLSERRANAVRSFLILYGIDESRMTTVGCGPDQPVASNETEEGRALNRRVELRKL